MSFVQAAASATRSFLTGGLAASAARVFAGAAPRPGVGTLCTRPATLGLALAGCAVVWHAARRAAKWLGVPRDAASRAAFAGAVAAAALARLRPDLVGAATELHAGVVFTAARTLSLAAHQLCGASLINWAQRCGHTPPYVRPRSRYASGPNGAEHMYGATTRPQSVDAPDDDPMMKHGSSTSLARSAETYASVEALEPFWAKQNVGRSMPGCSEGSLALARHCGQASEQPSTSSSKEAERLVCDESPWPSPSSSPSSSPEPCSPLLATVVVAGAVVDAA